MSIWDRHKHELPNDPPRVGTEFQKRTSQIIANSLPTNLNNPVTSASETSTVFMGHAAVDEELVAGLRQVKGWKKVQ